MSDPRDRLIAHLKVLARDISSSTAHRFMVLLRELLEARNDRKKYPTLTLYCDWSVHTKLDRSSGGSALLDILDDMFANSTTMDHQLQVLLSELYATKVRQQIIQLLGTSFIHFGVVLDDRAFASIISHVIADLVGKPISRRAADLTKRTSKRLAEGLRYTADRLQFSHNDDKEASSANYLLTLVVKRIDPPSTDEIVDEPLAPVVSIVVPWPILVTSEGKLLL
jgi:hypothetical protein